MGIFSRTRDIIAANVTDLLDRAEDPEKMIRQIIFEMNETLVEVRASAARTIADQKEMRRHIAKLESLQDSWKEKAELALSKDREDLATAALVEKQKAGDMAERLKAEIAVLDDALKGYEDDIAKLQKKLSEARARQSNVSTRLESAENKYRLREMTNGDRVEDAFSRFEILERRVDEAEGRADALNLGYKKSLDEEIAELQAADKVADELAALKADHEHEQQQPEQPGDPRDDCAKCHPGTGPCDAGVSHRPPPAPACSCCGGGIGGPSQRAPRLRRGRWPPRQRRPPCWIGR